MKTISGLSREYEIQRAAVLAVLEEHDVPIAVVGNAKCVRDEDARPVLPVFAKLRSKARDRRREAAAV